MSPLELVFLGVGLSMDAVAVSMTNAMVHRNSRARLVEMALLFALFQGLMPLAGHFIGSAVSGVISRLGGVAVLLILSIIGYKMLRSGLNPGKEHHAPSALTHRLLMVQAVATSIDALAVGVGLRAGATKILPASGIIAATTLLCCLTAVFIGTRFGNLLGKKAEIFGGLVLFIIGIRAVL